MGGDRLQKNKMIGYNVYFSGVNDCNLERF